MLAEVVAGVASREVLGDVKLLIADLLVEARSLIVERAELGALAATAPNGAAAPPFSWLTRFFPNVKPYPPGQGDADGLSRNIEDCNKGCIGVPIR